MKELTVEQKAKRYDEALEIINNYYQKIKYSSLSNASADREVLEKAFPELKGSEDERVRKEILKELKEQQNNIPYPPTPNEMARYDLLQRWIDWLKQDEQKLAGYTWKPSEEQLDALHDAFVYVDKSMFPYPKEILMKLYEQLKKLREEQV